MTPEPVARCLLGAIADHADVIGLGPGGEIFLLIALDPAGFDRLCAIPAEAEDMEPEEDLNDADEGPWTWATEHHPGDPADAEPSLDWQEQGSQARLDVGTGDGREAEPDRVPLMPDAA